MQTFKFIPAPDQQKFYSVFVNRNGDYLGTYDARDRSFNTSGERLNLRLEELKELYEKFEELSK